MIKNFSVHNDKDNSFYVINEDTGEQFSFESDYHILEYSTNDTNEEKGSPALFYTDVSNVEFFDEEGMKVGEIKENTVLHKRLVNIMEDYFRDDANEEFNDRFDEG